jgi:hypothetical protein
MHAFELSKTRRLGSRTYYYSPTTKEYDEIEEKIKELAFMFSYSPRQMQSMIWAGIKQEQGMTKNVSWSDLLRRKKGMFNFI